MGWFITGDVAEFLATTGDFLRSRPAENTVLLTVAETLRVRGSTAFGETAPIFGGWREPDGAITGAFLRTPPHPLLLSRAPGPALVELARALHGHDLSGVNGGQEAAEAFAAEWAERTGRSVDVGRRHRLYRLGELTPPDPPPPGLARLATPADRELLVDWYAAFVAEVRENDHSPGAAVDDRLSYGGFTVWEVDGGPVAVAGLTRQVAGMVRVGPVYTPPELRRRGYAGAVTAAVSRSARDAGAAEVLLFTDLANPTSNALYQRLGYQPVEDRVVLVFGLSHLPPGRRPVTGRSAIDEHGRGIG